MTDLWRKSQEINTCCGTAGEFYCYAASNNYYDIEFNRWTLTAEQAARVIEVLGALVRELADDEGDEKGVS